MSLNPYFTNNGYTQGRGSEQNILEDNIIESIDINGQEFIYIPRIYVAKDEILGEDRLSKFEKGVSINCYFENIDAFEGQGAYLTKFGYMLEQSASVIMAKKVWSDTIGASEISHLPNRPMEGDLMYFKLADSLFEIKFVQHQDPFYQLGKQYVYKIKIELYQYSSEKIDTNIEDIDAFESLKSHDVTIEPDVDTPDSYGDNLEFIEKAEPFVVDENNPFGEL